MILVGGICLAIEKVDLNKNLLFLALKYATLSKLSSM
jgi:hypothetical protein